MDAPLALYRRYRPDVFADVIGQEHVTAPLAQALDHNRVHHAYLFSGPRGCGKTTSARIMARALNCADGPTSTPCGTCESCVELARGGPGSIDVIEIDAASHGGVDDARDLREHAFFTPMRARYKVYIIDEAHMVSTQGFNALLKLVEEPPAHLRFIFATTEPDKVIGTIRSRTHHYPFRLVPPKMLGDYLLELCDREGVAIEKVVVPLIVRAGAGSVRDSLSVLDQLIGGSGPDGVTYALATSLLGYTPSTLLDETVDALAADDGATVFGVIDKVVDTGQDPRRFAEDLLQRLRDLVIVSAVPNAASRGLIEMSEDQAERLTGQAVRFGRAELTRAADIVSTGLTEMRGATAPRMLLELMCARILLPGADSSTEGFGARLDRIERRLSVVGDSAPTGSQPKVASVHTPASRSQASGWQSPADEPATPPRAATASPATPSADPRQPTSTAEPQPPNAPVEPATEAPDIAGPAQDAGTSPPSSALTAPSGPLPSAPTAPAGQLSLVDVRQLWPGVLNRVKTMRRYAWILLSQNAHVKDVGGNVITIGLVNAGARDSFTKSGADEILHQALIDELGVDWRVEAIIDAGTDQAPARTSTMTEPPVATAPEPDDGADDARAARSNGVQAAKGAIRTTRPAPTAGSSRQVTDEPKEGVTEIADDDDVIHELSSHELLTRELGAKVIEDIRHDSA